MLPYGKILPDRLQFDASQHTRLQPCIATRFTHGDRPRSTMEQLGGVGRGVSRLVCWYYSTEEHRPISGTLNHCVSECECHFSRMHQVETTIGHSVLYLQLAVWRCRGKVPLAVEITGSLVEISSRSALDAFPAAYLHYCIQ